MSTNQLGSEEWGLIATIDPATRAAGEQLSDAIDMSKWEQIKATLVIGVHSGASIDFALKSATASGGSYSAISGKSITQVGGSPLQSNKQWVINLRSGEVTSNNQYVKASVTLTGSPSAMIYTVIVEGKGRIKPSSDNDLASVSQIVA